MAASRRFEVWGHINFTQLMEKKGKSTTINTLCTSQYTTGSPSPMSASFNSSFSKLNLDQTIDWCQM